MVAVGIAARAGVIVAFGGAVVLAGRRGGLEDDDEHDVLIPLHLIRPQGTGTTAEGVGGQHR